MPSKKMKESDFTGHSAESLRTLLDESDPGKPIRIELVGGDAVLHLWKANISPQRKYLSPLRGYIEYKRYPEGEQG